jgi:dipeptidyl aminopeptidase/acylaminoacyl peptidase
MPPRLTEVSGGDAPLDACVVLERNGIVTVKYAFSFTCAATFCAATFGASLAGAASAQLPDLAAFRTIVRVSDPQVSPDGSRVAFIKTIRDYVRDKNVSQVMVIRTAGGYPDALTDGRAEVSSVRWSPDGRQLAFLSRGAHDKADQIFVMTAAGRGAHAITRVATDVEQFAWSPDGLAIAYVVQDEPDPQAQAIHNDLFDVHNDGYLTSAQPLPSHLWLVPAAGGKPRRLTSGPWSVLETDGPITEGPSDPSWSADGRLIAFPRQANADDSDSDKSTVAILEVRTGKVRQPTTRTQYEYLPSFAPRGDRLSYVHPRGPGAISANLVFLSEHGDEMGHALTADLDRDVEATAWLSDARGLLVEARDGVSVGLWLQPIGGEPARRLDLEGLVPGEFSTARSGAIAFVASSLAEPAELYVLQNPFAAPRALTGYNTHFLKFDQAASQEIVWTAPDGEKSDGLLTYPNGYVAGREYPLVLRIHGGPESSSTASYSNSDDLIRVLAAAHGYAVFEPNYRGSDNLGDAHEHAIFRDPGAGPALDVMSGIAALEKLGIVDRDRICVTGHSYGGYMTAWLIGHDTRWKCAVVGDGAVDWTATYNLSNAGNLAWARDSLGGSPWDPASAALYREGSPISYVSNMKTPTLIITGTADAVVPAVESYELYHALADNNVVVRFVAIPTALHFPRDPVRIEGYYRVTMEWIDKYLR